MKLEKLMLTLFSSSSGSEIILHPFLLKNVVDLISVNIRLILMETHYV